MRIEIDDSKWTNEYINSESDKIFIIEDNDFRIEDKNKIKSLNNTIGLRVKKGLSKKNISYYTDSEYDENVKKINEDIIDIKKSSLYKKTLVFSKNGYGLTSLKNKAPKTFKYLCDTLKINFGFDNEKGIRWSKIPGYDDISKSIYIKLDKISISNNGVLQPTSNRFFKDNLLNDGFNNIFDLIKSESKIAFTQNIDYPIGTYIVFVIPGLNEYLLVQITQSYKMNNISLEDWSLFEGFESEFIENRDTDSYYQIHFNYICSIEQSGKMVYKEGIFGDYENRKESMKNIEENIEEKMNKNDIHKNSNEELLSIISNLKIEVENLKKPFYLKIFNKFFKRKDIKALMKEKKLDGELIKMNVLSKSDNKKYYKLISDEYTHILIFKNGFFRNNLNILITLINEKNK